MCVFYSIIYIIYGNGVYLLCEPQSDQNVFSQLNKKGKLFTMRRFHDIKKVVVFFYFYIRNNKITDYFCFGTDIFPSKF